MKKIKSLLSILLSAVMIVTFVTGCGDSKDNKNSKPADSNAEVFTIAMTTYNEELEDWNGDGEYGEAIRNMFSEIEGEYNIRINIDYYSPTEFIDIAQASITNGDKDFADIMIIPLFTFGPLYAQGLLQDVSGINGIDVNSKVWSSEIKKLASFNGGVYGLGNSDLFNYAGSGCFYNKNMVKTLGLTDPAELVKKGEWTWEKLREYSLKAVKDVNNDGKFTADDRFGCTSQSYDGLVPAYMTCGVPTIKKDANGKLNYNMLSNDSVKALQKFAKTFTAKDGMFYAANMNALDQQQQFLDGKAMFLLGGWSEEGNPSDEFEIGVLPYPKYSASGNYVSAAYHHSRLITVPVISERTELIGKVLNLMGEKAQGLQKLAFEDASVNFIDREQYVEMYSKYIAPGYSVDPCMIMLNVNEAVSIGTMRAIAMPVFSDASYSVYTEGNAKTIQGILDEMFNGK